MTAPVREAFSKAFIEQPSQGYTSAVRLTTALAAISLLGKEWGALVQGRKDTEVKYRVFFYVETGALLFAYASPSHGTKLCTLLLLAHAFALGFKAEALKGSGRRAD